MDRILLEVRAGAGGDEAAIFAGDLVRMYQRFAEKTGWRFSVLDSNQTTLEGFKSLVAEIKGEGVREALQHESGVHRVQRIPKTEKSGRVHTSTASVAVMPVVEPQEFDLNPSDLDISFFRSSGPGGQNVNKVETAVRIVHKPTGVVVASQSGRSQSANKESAMSMLRSKIYEEMQRMEAEKRGDMRRSQIGSGDRSEKIRTYNFPQDRVTDHRIGKKWHNIESLLEGNLEPVVKAFKKAEEEK